MIPLDFQKKHREGQELLLTQNFAQALLHYEKLTRQWPGMAVIWAEYGNVASRLGQIILAERAWQKAIVLDPRNAELIGMIGHQYQGLRRPEKARACFAQAASADPRSINSRISLAVLLEQQHQLEQSREAVAQCLAIDPRDDQARYFLAVLDRRGKKIPEGEEPFAELIKTPPQAPYTRYACASQPG